MFENLSHTYLPVKPELWHVPRFVVDEEKCTGCGNCIKACPMACLELVEGKPRYIEKMACLACSACVTHCEKGAMEMVGFYRVDKGFWRTLSFHLEDGYPKIPEVEGIEGLTPVEEVIYKRRSNRIFSKKPVPDELVRRVIEAGRFAPSHGNYQPWAFIVVNDREEMDRIAEAIDPITRRLTRFFFSGQTNPVTRRLISILAPLVPRMFDQRAQTGGACFLLPNDVFLGAPCLIILLGDRRGINNPDLDIGICGTNMVLAAHSLGLVTCWLGFTISINYCSDLKKRYGIKWPYKVVSGIVLGYPRVNADSLVKRELPRITWIKGGKRWVEMP